MERGIGVAREHASLPPRASTTEEERVEVFFEETIVVRPPRPQKNSDPLSFSPHVLDLRHVHRPSTFSASPPSLVSRFFSFLQKRNVRANATALPPPAFGFPRFPAIMLADIESATPSAPVFSSPLYSQLSIGTFFLLCVRCLSFVAPAVWFVRLRRAVRYATGTLRYLGRRFALEVADRMPHISIPAVQPLAVVRVPIGRSNARMRTIRGLIVFVVMAAIVTIPFHAFSSFAAVGSAQSLQERGSALAADAVTAVRMLQAGDWDAARVAWAKLHDESTAFGASAYLTHPVIGPLASIVSPKFRTGRTVIESVIAFADAGIAATMIGAELQSNRTPTERLVRIQPAFRDLAGAANRFSDATERIDSAYLPGELRTTYAEWSPLIAEAKNTVERIGGVVPLLPILLGHDRPERYLVLFQNDAEARATGGFIGSVAVADIEQGVVRKIFMPNGGSYDLQGALRVNERAPEPLQYVNPRFEFHDANWWPDFPTSARKLLFLWEKSGEPTVDGVIAVNASFFERLLPILGPVDMPAYGKRISADNFFFETQKAVELDYDRAANTPKKFLRDLAEAVLARFGTIEKTTMLPLARELLDAVATKDVQVYAVDPAIEAALAGNGIAGAMARGVSEEDSLAVVRTNIGGAKTDRVIRDSIIHETVIGDDGSLQDRMTLTRVHTGKSGDLFTGARSRDYLRIYVPKGATLLDAQGFSLPTRTREMPPEEYASDPDLAYLDRAVTDADKRVTVGEESGQTFFSGWIELDPGEVKTIVLTYHLPFAVSSAIPHYRLSLQKQSGIQHTTVMHRTLLPASLSLDDDTAPSLRGPIAWKYDMSLLQTFHRQ